jgi:hypothetical protein
MPSGNGCRAQMKRDRNNAKLAAAGKVTTAEDRKKHEAAKNAIQCTICMTGFPRTTGQAELQQHVDSRHAKTDKTFAQVFPAFGSSQE